MKKYYTDEFVAFENENKILIVLDTSFMVPFQEKILKKNSPIMAFFDEKTSFILQSDQISKLKENTSIDKQEYAYVSVNKGSKSKNLKMKIQHNFSLPNN